jgi:hypothetical protein
MQLQSSQAVPVRPPNSIDRTESGTYVQLCTRIAHYRVSSKSIDRSIGRAQATASIYMPTATAKGWTEFKLEWAASQAKPAVHAHASSRASMDGSRACVRRRVTLVIRWTIGREPPASPRELAARSFRACARASCKHALRPGATIPACARCPATTPAGAPAGGHALIARATDRPSAGRYVARRCRCSCRRAIGRRVHALHACMVLHYPFP